MSQKDQHKIASIQLNSNDNTEKNMHMIEQLVKQAKNQGASLVLLPENCAFMGANQSAIKMVAEPLGNGPIQTLFAKMAQKYRLWILVGAFATIDQNKTYQTLLVYDELGHLVEHYHKRHLFNVTLPNHEESYRESDAFHYGKTSKVITTPLGKIGLAICYDLRFPEHFRNLIDLGAEIFVLPAAFTSNTGRAHWEILLRARAIENQCFVIASGQSGEHPSRRKTWGHSMIINPWGEILTKLKAGEGVIIAAIDLAELRHQRQVFPVLSHRRLLD